MGPLLPFFRSFDFWPPITWVLFGLAVKILQLWATLGVLHLDVHKVVKPCYSFLCLLDSEEILHWNPCCKTFQYLCRRWVYHGIFSAFLALGNGISGFFLIPEGRRESAVFWHSGGIFPWLKNARKFHLLVVCLDEEKKILIWSIFRVGFHWGQMGSDISFIRYREANWWRFSPSLLRLHPESPLSCAFAKCLKHEKGSDLTILHFGFVPFQTLAFLLGGISGLGMGPPIPHPKDWEQEG